MDKETNFMVFCIEEYKKVYRLSGKEVIELFKKYHVLDYVIDYYEALHTTSSQYIVDDIMEYITSQE